MSDSLPPLEIPPRSIPIPTTISREAQNFLAYATRRNAARGDAKVDIKAGADAALEMMRPRAAGFAGDVESIDLGNGALLYRITPADRSPERCGVAYFDVHGGGFVAGGGEMCKILAQLRAIELGAEVWAVDYRLAPTHSHPAALDDCMAAYRHVLAQLPAERVVVAGGSAGGNLAAAMLLRARDEGLELAAGLILMTPVTDMSGAGDTRATNLQLDVTLAGGGDVLSLYCGSGDPADPYLSPVLGDFTKGWPPTLLSSGTRDLLLSDTVRMHRALRRAGVRAELHVAEAAPHGGFMGTAPEDHELIAECRRFCEECWGLA